MAEDVEVLEVVALVMDVVADARVRKEVMLYHVEEFVCNVT